MVDTWTLLKFIQSKYRDKKNNWMGLTKFSIKQDTVQKDFETNEKEKECIKSVQWLAWRLTTGEVRGSNPSKEKDLHF